MRNIRVHPFPVSNDPRLAQWQSAVAHVAKENILNDHPDIDPEELKNKVMTHPMVQGSNFHVEEADGQGRKLTPEHISTHLATIKKPDNIHPLVHAFLSQHHFDSMIQNVQLGGNSEETRTAISTPVEFPYSDYAYAQWAKCAAIWGVDGNPIPSPYVNINEHGGPTSDFGVIEIPENSKIAILGDFGTGLNDATTLLIAMLQQLDPDFIIHLGDIYYSGTEDECQTYVDTFNTAFARAGKKVPVFSIPGNHEYYAGGWGFFSKVIAMNQANGFGNFAQQASYFSLRTSGGKWQFLGMDTGYNSVHNFNVAHPTQVNASYAPWLEFGEAAWHQDKLQSFPGKSILLSHHQLFSEDAVINDGRGVVYKTGSNVGGLKYLNGNLLSVFQPYFSRVAAWYWGHEHSMDIFASNQQQLSKGRLVGNSGYEEWQGENPYQPTDSPYHTITPRPELDVTPVPWLGTRFNFYNHGFTIITLNSVNAQADYYEFPVFSPSSSIPSTIPNVRKFAYRSEVL